jgi:hypothetical protein
MLKEPGSTSRNPLADTPLLLRTLGVYLSDARNRTVQVHVVTDFSMLGKATWKHLGAFTVVATRD